MAAQSTAVSYAPRVSWKLLLLLVLAVGDPLAVVSQDYAGNGARRMRTRKSERVAGDAATVVSEAKQSAGAVARGATARCRPALQHLLSSPKTPAPQLYFYHLSKCGGRAVERFMEAAQEQEAQSDYKFLYRQFDIRGMNPAFQDVHMPNTFRSIVLRDPMERFASWVADQRHAEDPEVLVEVSDDMLLHTAKKYRNYYTQVLAGGQDAEDADAKHPRSGGARCRKALDELRTAFAIVGTTSQLLQFSVVSGYSLKWDDLPPVERVKVHEGAPGPDGILPLEVQENFKRLNACDYRLYELAKRLADRDLTCLNRLDDFASYFDKAQQLQQDQPQDCVAQCMKYGKARPMDAGLVNSIQAKLLNPQGPEPANGKERMDLRYSQLLAQAEEHMETNPPSREVTAEEKRLYDQLSYIPGFVDPARHPDNFKRATKFTEGSYGMESAMTKSIAPAAPSSSAGEGGREAAPAKRAYKAGSKAVGSAGGGRLGASSAGGSRLKRASAVAAGSAGESDGAPARGAYKAGKAVGSAGGGRLGASSSGGARVKSASAKAVGSAGERDGAPARGAYKAGSKGGGSAGGGRLGASSTVAGRLKSSGAGGEASTRSQGSRGAGPASGGGAAGSQSLQPGGPQKSLHARRQEYNAQTGGSGPGARAGRPRAPANGRRYGVKKSGAQAQPADLDAAGV